MVRLTRSDRAFDEVGLLSECTTLLKIRTRQSPNSAFIEPYSFWNRQVQNGHPMQASTRLSPPITRASQSILQSRLSTRERNFGLHPTRYEECQTLADLARAADIDLIKYASVRDHHHRPNHAILRGRVFTNPEPITRQTWRLLLGSNGARALCEMPRETIDFDRSAFQSDPRLSKMRWDR